MPSETPKIKYNLKERGRVHTGQSRASLNIRAVCDAINSPACQERVATRGMIGFFGHFPRRRFGMRPAEGGIDKGQYVPVEPAFVTTYLKADYDGTVEHRAEFTDTESGIRAKKLFDGRIGGFSSAISPDCREFFGFDFVYEPNYLSNSHLGAIMDSAGGMSYDELAAAELDEHAHGMIHLLDSIEVERVSTNAVIERLTEENEQLLSMLARTSVSAGAVLDSAAVRPLVVSVDAAHRLQRDRDFFLSERSLPGFVEPPKGDTQPGALYDRTVQRFRR